MKTRVSGVLAAALLATGIAAWLLLRTAGGEAAPALPGPRPSAPEPSAGAAGGSGGPSDDAPMPMPMPVTRRVRGGGGAGTPLVWGRVAENGERKPIAGAEVLLFDYARAAESATRTDVEGYFAFPETRGRDGLFRLAISSAGYGSPLHVEVRPSVEPAVHELAPGSVIKGRVVQAVTRLPITSYRIQAVRHPFERLGDYAGLGTVQHTLPLSMCAVALEAVHDPEGRFELRDLLPGKFALIVSAEGYPPTSFGGWPPNRDGGVHARRADEAQPVTIELLPAGDLFVRVLDKESGTPVLGAVLDLALSVGWWCFPFRQRLDHPDTEGRHRIRVAVNPDRSIDFTYLTITKQGYAPWFGHIGVDSGGSSRCWREGSTLDVLLGRGARVRGTVRDEAGRPVAGSVLVVDGFGTEAAATGRSQADGTYELGPLPCDTDLLLHCFAPSLAGLLGAAPLRLQEGEVRRVDLGGGGAGAIFGRVTLHGAPLSGVTVCVNAAADQEDTAIGLTLRSAIDTGPDGRFRVQGLAPGNYDVSGEDENAGRDLRAKRCVTLERDRSEEVNLAFGGVISGVLLDADSGEPLADTGIEVGARLVGAAGRRDHMSARSDERGRFTLWVPGPAEYELLLLDTDSWFLESAPRVDLRAVSAVEGLLVRVRPDPGDGRITLRVVDAATGEPVQEGRYDHGGSWGALDAAKVEASECSTRVHRFVIYSDVYVPRKIDVAITPSARIVEQEVRLQRSNAVLITAVDAKGNGWKAGLRPGDVVTEYAGAPTLNVVALEAAIANAPHDAPMRLSVRRGAQTVSLSAPGGPLGIVGTGYRCGR